jgi:5-formyltetrahydrofolate cyclo-ligase
MMGSVHQRKADVRAQVRARLALLDLRLAREDSAAIIRRLEELPELGGAQWVAAYVSFGTEVETQGLIRQLLGEGRHVCIPSFDWVGQRYICSQLKNFDADLAEGRLGILEPKPAAVRPVHTDLPDVWVVPGLAFDTSGNRLGRGMGYFDQLLADARGVKVALAYDFQVLDEVPAAPHDVRMDFIVTEHRTIKCWVNHHERN